jgi:cytochrome b subunit of formate dehydrogenase
MSGKKSHLTLYICIAIVAAVGLALFSPTFAMKFHIGGEIF